MASKTSHIPPCPGIIEPESLISPSRLIADSRRSPRLAKTEIKIPKRAASIREKRSHPKKLK